MATSITSEFGEAEARRRAAECALKEKEECARKWAQRREKIGSGFRQLFTYALLGTVVILVWIHRNDMQSFFQMEYDRYAGTHSTASSSGASHHNTSSHQNEIDQVSQ